MSDANTLELSFLAKLVIATAIALLVVGSLWYGFTFRAIGLAMGVIYQALVLKTFYPDEALVAALLLGLSRI